MLSSEGESSSSSERTTKVGCRHALLSAPPFNSWSKISGVDSAAMTTEWSRALSPEGRSRYYLCRSRMGQLRNVVPQALALSKRAVLFETRLSQLLPVGLEQSCPLMPRDPRNRCVDIASKALVDD